MKDSYESLKNRIGRVPYLIDYIKNFSVDPLVLINSSHTNYHLFLSKLKENPSTLTEYENQVLTMLSIEILNGKRVHELILLNKLEQNKKISMLEYKELLDSKEYISDEATIQSAVNILNLSFFKDGTKSKYGSQPLIRLTDGNTLVFTDQVEKSLENNNYFRNLFKDILSVGFKKNEDYVN